MSVSWLVYLQLSINMKEVIFATVEVSGLLSSSIKYVLGRLEQDYSRVLSERSEATRCDALILFIDTRPFH